MDVFPSLASAMKVSYPLSLKVSFWLLLNLLLLGGVGVGFFVIQDGVGWTALLAGNTGDRMIGRSNSISVELGAAGSEGHAAVLSRVGATYGAEYSLYRAEDASQPAAAELPTELRTRLDAALAARTFGRDFGPGRGGRPDTSGRGPPNERYRRPGGPGEGVLRGPPDPVRERENQRFIVRAGTPAKYWVVTRVFYLQPDRRPMAAMMLARLDSFWGLLRYLNLESWVLGGAAVLGLSVIFWLPLVHGITHAIGRLTRATEQIADGRFDTRVPADRRDELGKLGESVNRMAARLDAHIGGQKKFLGDVAHELCTPLARMQMASGILSERAPADLRETVADLRDEVQQMSTLVNELLMFTKSGLQSREAKLVDVLLAPLVASVIAREDTTAKVTAHVPSDLTVRADPDLLSRALGNLVRNAVRYAADAGPITVSAAREDARARITVEDEGTGVPADALDRLGEPFFRPEAARARESGGVGLGLSIVRSSVAACGGDVRFANRQPRGFRAEIRLPLPT